MKQEYVRSVDGERWNDDQPVTIDGALDQVGEAIDWIALIMLPVTVRRLDDEQIGIAGWLGRQQKWMAAAAEVATEPDHGASSPGRHGHFTTQRCGAEDVTGNIETTADRLRRIERRSEVNRVQQLERCNRLRLGVQRKRWAVPRIAGGIGELGFLFEQAPAVG